MDVELTNDDILVMTQEIMNECVTFVNIVLQYFLHHRRLMSNIDPTRVHKHYSLVSKIPKQIDHLHGIIRISDVDCFDSLRMSRDAFARLCHLVEYSGGLKGNRNVSVYEQLAMFLSILAHHTKIRIVKNSYNRSGRTVSKHFHGVLNAIIRLHSLLLAKPDPIEEDCTNERWKWFKGCLGALDGTCIPAKVMKSGRGRYRNRKGQVSVNVLAVCDRYMNFVYVLTGWEGSAADSRVLRDAVTRNNGLRVPIGNYYLCDNGYVNGEGFLTPYRGIRYHLNDWGRGRYAPQSKEEYFNMKHSKARNVIERTFGLLKMRWAILRSPSFYPIKVHNRIILACCLLHNFIRKVMPTDPLEDELPQFVEQDVEQNHEANMDDYIEMVESSQQWTNWRNSLATSMYNEWRG